MNKYSLLTCQSNRNLSQFLKELFEEFGFHVDVTRSPKTCLSLMKQYFYNAVLLDDILAKRDDYNIITDIRKTKSKKAKVIVSTLYADETTIDVFKYGIDGLIILSKIEPDNLLLKVQDYIQGRISRNDAKQETRRQLSINN